MWLCQKHPLRGCGTLFVCYLQSYVAWLGQWLDYVMWLSQQPPLRGCATTPHNCYLQSYTTPPNITQIKQRGQTTEIPRKTPHHATQNTMQNTQQQRRTMEIRWLLPKNPYPYHQNITEVQVWQGVQVWAGVYHFVGLCQKIHTHISKTPPEVQAGLARCAGSPNTMQHTTLHNTQHHRTPCNTQHTTLRNTQYHTTLITRQHHTTHTSTTSNKITMHHKTQITTHHKQPRQHNTTQHHATHNTA